MTTSDINMVSRELVGQMRAVPPGEARITSICDFLEDIGGLPKFGGEEIILRFVDLTIQAAKDQWALAMDVVGAVRRLGHERSYQICLTRLVAAFPNEYWILYAWAQSASSLPQRDVWWRRTRYALSRFEADIRFTEMFAMSAMRARKFGDVLRLPNLDALPRADSMRKAAQTYLNVERACRAAELGNPVDYSVFCINLDHKTDRMAAILDEFIGEPVVMRRVPGIRGSYLPDALREHIMAMGASGTPSQYKGAFGCFLSHVSAWETFLRTTDKFALMIEDDAEFLASVPRSITSLGLPDEADIVFVNSRTESMTRWGEPCAEKYELIDAEDSMLSRPNEQSAFGGDGYILSRAGAIKALERVNKSGFNGDVDWWLALLSVPRLQVRLGAPEPSAEEASPALKGFCLFPSLINSGAWGSSREEESGVWRR